MELLDLKENQFIKIHNKKYEVLNKVKFIEKGGYWIEYKLRDDVGNVYYLNVEENLKTVLYEILRINTIAPEMRIIYNNNEYELFEKGNGIVETYYGLVDVGLREQVEYYEYVNISNKDEILSIEKWKHETEISLGHVINKKDIKK